MKRLSFAVVRAAALLALTLAAANASAQQPPLPPPSPAAEPVTPVAPGVQVVPLAPVQGGVRIHVRTFKAKGTARIYIHRADGSYTFLCASPCTADVPPNSELRATLANNDEEPHTFVVPSDLGPEIDLEVRPASIGPLVGGIVMMGSGGAFVLSGLLFIALSDVQYNTSYGGSRVDTSGTYKTVGFVMMGIGAAAAVGGLVWLLSRSHEPQVREEPARAPEVYGRRDLLLGDVAAAKPRDPASLTPPPITPLQYGFTF